MARILAAVTLVAALLAVGCAATSSPAARDGTRDQPGSYAVRPWHGGPSQAAPRNAAEPGQVAPELATPHSLALRWPIAGDHNGNAVVKLSYRQLPDGPWRDGLPLFWVHPDKTPDHLKVTDGRLFAGSIVDLAPGTRYEVRLALSDPDGGSTSRSLTLETTREPVEPAGLRQRHVVPDPDGAGGGTGSAQDPFRGLQSALDQAMPGDLVLVHGGTYRAGGLRPARAGQPGKPIVLRAAGDGPAVLDGGDQDLLLDLSGLAHIWLERLTFRKAHTLVRAVGAHHLVIRHNRFEPVKQHKAIAVYAADTRERQSTGFFITDNTIVGPVSWPRAGQRGSVYGVSVTGSGHVVAYNHMAFLADGIHNGDIGNLSASDFNNNDIVAATDDCIEADYATTNLRVFRNRLTNCFAAVSTQPALGGPVYIFRNLMLNTTYTPVKLHNHTAGVLIFHNTSVRAGMPFKIRPGRETVNDVITRNNIFIGTDGPALRTSGVMTRTDFDNDGYGWNGRGFASWNGKRYRSPSATWGTMGLYDNEGVVVLSQWGEFATGLAAPDSVKDYVDPSKNDPRLDGDSRAVDAGVVLANFNDGFRGAAPDLGCCELGEALPHFGPRP